MILSYNLYYVKQAHKSEHRGQKKKIAPLLWRENFGVYYLDEMIRKSNFNIDITKNILTRRLLIGIAYQIKRHSLTQSKDISSGCRYTITLLGILYSGENEDEHLLIVECAGYCDLDKRIIDLSEQDLYECVKRATSKINGKISEMKITPANGILVPPPLEELSESLLALLDKYPH